MRSYYLLLRTILLGAIVNSNTGYYYILVGVRKESPVLMPFNRKPSASWLLEVDLVLP